MFIRRQVRFRLSLFRSYLPGCTCSVGIGNSILLARLALKDAKPNGIAAAPFLNRDSHTVANRRTNLNLSLFVEHRQSHVLDETF